MIIDIPPAYEQYIQELAQEKNLSVGEYVVSLLPKKESNVEIDIERMDKAIQSERFLMPQGLSREEKRRFILAFAQS